MDRRRLLLSLLLLWFMGIVVIFFFFGNRSAAVFAFAYTIIYGGICYRYRDCIRSLLNGIRLPVVIKFFGIAFLVAAAEEVFCYLTGNRIALPVLWADILFCGLAWFGWFGAWYFFLSKKYRYSATEALLLAGMAGILYEGIGPVLANPVAVLPVLVIAPFIFLVYAAIFVVPMQLISFTGTKEGLWKYPVSIVLPYLASLPIVLVLFLFFTFAEVPLY
ncbi:MAG: hypothetical protein A4E28_01299 [Methanocella sp. PtaU1.Bin125]|nr:MAG: hypothetical protein A4E28_01299 [Methanocella sp. PtaU1.Bin125]